MKERKRLKRTRIKYFIPCKNPSMEALPKNSLRRGEKEIPYY